MPITDEFKSIAHAKCRGELKAAVATVANNLINLERRFDERQSSLERDVDVSSSSLAAKIDQLSNSLTTWMLNVENRIGKSDGKLVIFTGLAFAAGAALFSTMRN